MTLAEAIPPERACRDPATDWPRDLYDVLKAAGIRQMSYVPDAGHATLIRLFETDAGVTTNVLTTEEEGIAIATGAWLGGARAVVLMQSSGVGNCINMLSLPVQTRTPLLMLVTMRGEWGEFNPWQVPMGRATQTVLEAVGVRCFPVEHADEIGETFVAAADFAFHGNQSAAVLVSQRVIGAKGFGQK